MFGTACMKENNYFAEDPFGGRTDIFEEIPEEDLEETEEMIRRMKRPFEMLKRDEIQYEEDAASDWNNGEDTDGFAWDNEEDADGFAWDNEEDADGFNWDDEEDCAEDCEKNMEEDAAENEDADEGVDIEELLSYIEEDPEEVDEDPKAWMRGYPDPADSGETCFDYTDEEPYDNDAFYDPELCGAMLGEIAESIGNIQKRLLKHLKKAIETEAYCCEIPGINLNWDDLNEMDDQDMLDCVQNFIAVTEKYGPADVSGEVEDFMTNGIYVLDLLKLKSGIKKNFVSLNQYKVQMPEGKRNAKIMQKKWMKRLMRYAIPAKLREETDPITEWIIQKNDRKLVEKAIKQNYIGKKNAGKLLEYAASLKNTETDPRIRELLETEMKGSCDAL